MIHVETLRETESDYRAPLRRENGPRIVPLAAPVILALLGLGLALGHFTFILDDPYVSFRYAGNFAAGHGLVFNPGERVEGYTNLLWVLLLAIPLKLGGDPVFWSKVLGAGFFVASIVCLWALARRTLRGQWTALLAGAVLAGNWYAALWSIGGLETAMFTFWLVAGLLAYVQRRPTATAALLLAASLTRPEGPLFFAIVAAVEGVRCLSSKRWADWLRMGGVYAVGFGLHVAWRLSYYGEWLPNTYYAKTGGEVAETLVRGSAYVSAFLLSLVGAAVQVKPLETNFGWAMAVLAVFLILTGAALIGSLRSGRWAIAVSALWAILYLGYVVRVGGDWMPGCRFGVPAIPFLALLAAFGFERLQGPKAGAGRTAFLGLSAAVLLIFGNLAQHQVIRFKTPWLQPAWSVFQDAPNRAYFAVAEWLNRHTPPGDLIAVEEAGVIPYFTDRRFLDLFGLVDKELARAPGKPPFSKFNDEYVLSRAPDFMVLWVLHDERGEVTWAPHAQLMRRSEFQSHYRLVQELPRGQGAFLIFERVD